MSTFDAPPELHELTLNDIFNGCAVFEGFCHIVCRHCSSQRHGEEMFYRA